MKNEGITASCRYLYATCNVHFREPGRVFGKAAARSKPGEAQLCQSASFVEARHHQIDHWQLGAVL